MGVWAWHFRVQGFRIMGHRGCVDRGRYCLRAQDSVFQAQWSVQKGFAFRV